MPCCANSSAKKRVFSRVERPEPWTRTTAGCGPFPVGMYSVPPSAVSPFLTTTSSVPYLVHPAAASASVRRIINLTINTFSADSYTSHFRVHTFASSLCAFRAFA
jgi:hypothetical protein